MTADTTVLPNVAFVGFGEAAQAFWSGFKTGSKPIAKAYDIKTDSASHRIKKEEDYARTGIIGCGTLGEALAGSEVAFSLVTADQALAAATAASECLPSNILWLDCNSCAPQTKGKNADIISGGGGRYVDIAIMAPVYPRLHRTPLLISGTHAVAAAEALESLGMDVSVVSNEVGAASSIKLCRSIMIKGLEALVAECVLTGRTLGVEDTVLRTLEETFPGFGWDMRAANMLERMIVHGHRRAAEMRETAAMVEGVGLPARMARSTATWQQQIGELGLRLEDCDLAAHADVILASLTGSGGGRRKSRVRTVRK